MAKNARQSKTGFRSLGDKAYDLFGELLLERETTELLAEIEQDKANGNTEEMDTFFALHDAKNSSKFNRYFRRQHAHRLFCETLPKIGQIAAVLIAVITIAGGIAIATSHTIRVQVMKLLIHIDEQCTELRFVEDTEASFEIPTEWKGEYYPSYIPEGLTVNTVYPWLGDSSVEFINKETGNLQIAYSEYNTSTETNIDTEDTVV